MSVRHSVMFHKIFLCFTICAECKMWTNFKHIIKHVNISWKKKTKLSSWSHLKCSSHRQSSKCIHSAEKIRWRDPAINYAIAATARMTNIRQSKYTIYIINRSWMSFDFTFNQNCFECLNTISSILWNPWDDFKSHFMCC